MGPFNLPPERKGPWNVFSLALLLMILVESLFVLKQHVQLVVAWCMSAIDYVLKNKNSSNFTRDANWPPNHKTYFGFALPCLWNVIIHFLIWCGWLGSGQIGRFLTGIITFHRPGRAKCKKCFVVRESMCISGEIRGIFGFSKRNL